VNVIPHQPPLFRKLLIANRGEIAVRLIRACRELGISPMAVYSEADADAMHVRLADEAMPIGPPPPAESYLNIDKIVAAALAAGAQAVHPGYGFLSESAEFAEAVRAAGLVFVGPPADVMRRMGNKTEARALMQTAGVPIVPGSQAAGDTDWARAAAGLGYPVLVKAAGGGGGRGMRIVDREADLLEALRAAQVEAASAFGNPTVFIEKYIRGARHIEFQVFGDADGHVLQLFERECSIQRRHQKIIEESPSPLLDAHPELRTAMAAAAISAAKAVGYQNAGTIEFIVDPPTLEFYFLEMNTRLQVEHPVTEAVTGLDLVHWQLLVAAGAPLPVSQEQVTTRGHALECRIYAEDPAREFYPSIGKILLAVEPRGPGIRVDAGFETGDMVSQHYDALLAKVICFGADRASTLARMQAALGQYVLLGLTTNLPFLQAVLNHPEFRAGTATTQFITEGMRDWQPGPAQPPHEVFIAAALAEHLGLTASQAVAGGPAAADGDPHSPWNQTDGFRLGGA
jgi:3-methylcrotonyl-CoA carboxylase alpha subunit